MWDSGSLRRERYLSGYNIVIGKVVWITFPLPLSFIPLLFFLKEQENVVPGP